MSSKRILFLTQASAVTRIFPQLREANIEASLAENAKGASSFVRSFAPQIIVTRPSLSGYKAEELFAEAKHNPDYPQIVITTENGTADEARHFMELGAYDYWVGPLLVEKLIALSQIENFPNLNRGEKSGRSDKHDRHDSKSDKNQTKIPKIVGRSPAMRRALALAKQVAPSKATVLINGESGTGKEMFSKNLHGWSNRANAPFIAINCAALPEHLLESELFGHEKGSFTGAIGKKVGKFELASGGTLLLDEISEMDLGLQAKLLRALQEGEIDRVGGTEAVKVDVRVIATTNRHLEDWVKEGKFRQDLYFRLNVIPLRLPSLRERGNDIMELAHFFVHHYTKEYQLPTTKFTEEAIAWLKQYDWPGNVRELQNLMERAVLLAAGKSITAGHFLLDGDDWPLFGDDFDSDFDDDFNGEFNDEFAYDFENTSEGCKNDEQTSKSTFKNASNGQNSNHAEAHAQQGHLLTEENSAQNMSQNFSSTDTASKEEESPQKTTQDDLFSGSLMPLHEVERLMIKKGLAVTSGNRTQAAELLGISVRTLRNKLNEYREQGFEVE